MAPRKKTPLIWTLNATCQGPATPWGHVRNHYADSQRTLKRARGPVLILRLPHRGILGNPSVVEPGMERWGRTAKEGSLPGKATMKYLSQWGETLWRNKIKSFSGQASKDWAVHWRTTFWHVCCSKQQKFRVESGNLTSAKVQTNSKDLLPLSPSHEQTPSAVALDNHIISLPSSRAPLPSHLLENPATRKAPNLG